MTYGKEFIAYAQILRSQGMSVKNIQAKLGVGNSWVKHHTKGTVRTPQATIADTIDLLSTLIFKLSLKAHKDNCENPMHYSLPMSQFAATLKTLVEVAGAQGRMNMLECIETLQKTHPDASEEFQHTLQAVYDEELAKG